MKKTLMVLSTAFTLALTAPVLSAHADNDEHEGGERGGMGGMGSTMAGSATIQKECGDCHMVFPPQLLPSAAWSTIMNDLPNHFGEDASLDEATRAKIENYLVQNSSNRGSATPLRISERRWFQREHRGTPGSGRLSSLKSWANCQACHRGAAQGMFHDD